MDTREVIARFEAERQVLALMDHPNIAKVFDAERTETGRPYFVMELVEGVPITNYCDECELTTRERLELFVTVCQAVQHAHQRGVIHRDLKPTNVLAAIRDGQPAPKIIDFGVAKAIQQRLTERTLTTAFAQLVGTPMYMSPEQAELSPLGVDTRTDVYSLGVLLYELLTGTTPFDKERVYAASSDEMRRIIREEEPPRPSARISMFKADLATTIGERHRTDTRRLLQSVHGELDWIVMKCLEKDRNRRYESASALADDVQRHLVDEPVEACPPSAIYRLRKMTRRYKGTMAAVVTVAVILVVSSAFSTWQAVRATRAFDAEFAVRKDADDAKLKAEAEAQNAKTEAAIAQAVNDSLNQDLLQQANPEWTPYDQYNEPTGDLKLRTVLDRAAASLDGRFADQPLVEAALRHTIGVTYAFLGDNDLAALHLQRAVDLREARLGREHPTTLASMTKLAFAKGDLELMKRVVETSRRVLGKHHPNTLYWMFSLALATRSEGEQSRDDRYNARAIELFRETLDAQRKVLGEDDIQTAWTMHCLAHTLVMNAGKIGMPQADDREIESLYRRARAVFGKNGREASWNEFDITLRLGEFLNSRRRYQEAEELLQDALRQLDALSGASPEKTAQLAALLEAVHRNWRKPEHETNLEGKRSSEETGQKEPQVENE